MLQCTRCGAELVVGSPPPRSGECVIRSARLRLIRLLALDHFHRHRALFALLDASPTRLEFLFSHSGFFHFVNNFSAGLRFSTFWLLIDKLAEISTYR